MNLRLGSPVALEAEPPEFAEPRVSVPQVGPRGEPATRSMRSAWRQRIVAFEQPAIKVRPRTPTMLLNLATATSFGCLLTAMTALK
jgi:hypothetical protein